MNPVIETYSRLASKYDDPRNTTSCWGHISRHSLGLVTVGEQHKVVADIGCGTGRELAQLASRHSADVHFMGVEPAAKMRDIAIARTVKYPNVRIVDGRFEDLPLESKSVDYVYSVLAFHWTTDLDRSVGELARVLKSTGEMDLTFIGRHNGREFILATTPVFFKYMSPAAIVQAASLRRHLTRETAVALFRKVFSPCRLSVTESYHTYYDTLEGHWGWWVRIEGQFVHVPETARAKCNQAVKAAIAALSTDKGIPYTVHLLHVRLRHA